MAQSLASDFVIYNAEFNGGFNEALQQNTEAFNEASENGLRLVTERLRGHYDKESFFDNISGLVSRRDITSTSTADDTAMTQDDFIGVKLNRKVGPIALSLDSLKKIGQGEDAQREASFIVGQQSAKAIMVDYLDTALAAVEAKLDATTALENDKASTGTMLTEYLAQGLGKFSDAAGDIVCWIMHGKVYWDLVEDQITDTATVYSAGGMTILGGSAVTMGRPVIVTDSDSLVETDGVSSGTDAYSTIGLRRGGVEVVESEPPTMVSDLVTGQENMFYRIQGEHAYNLRLAGCEWKTATGSNPTDAQVATGSNWPTVVTSNKLLPGVIIKTQ